MDGSVRWLVRGVEIGQILGPNEATAREDRCALEHTVQFSYVTWPMVAAQKQHRGLIDALERTTELASEGADQSIDQQRNILAPLPKWGNVNRKDLRSIKEICAKALLGDLRFEASIRRADDSNVDRDRLRGSHAL